MKTTTGLLFLLLPLFSLAQFKYSEKNKKEKPGKDSADYFLQRQNNMIKNAIDSVLHSGEYQELAKKRASYIKSRNNYTGAAFFVDVAHANYTEFNKSIAQSGFPELSNICYRFGFGVSTKTNRLLLDFYFITAGFNNKVQKGDEKIKTSFSSLFQVDMGVDLLKSQRVSIYPYAGLSLRLSDINYQNPATINPSYTNVSDMIINNTSIELTSFKIGYQAGVGFDYRFRKPGDRTTASSIVFLKAGTNSAIGKEVYHGHGIKYEPGIRQGDFMLTFGFKFVSNR